MDTKKKECTKENEGVGAAQLSNNEKFNLILNKSKNPRKIYRTLMSFKPCVEQTDYMFEKSEIPVGKLFSWCDIT